MKSDWEYGSGTKTRTYNEFVLTSAFLNGVATSYVYNEKAHLYIFLVKQHSSYHFTFMFHLFAKQFDYDFNQNWCDCSGFSVA